MEESKVAPSRTASTTASPALMRRLVAIPPPFAQRRRGRAWALSLIVHGSVLALALWGLGREVIAPPPPVRVVFVEPPPPPPPLGAPEGKGDVPVVEPPPKPVEKPKPVAKPEPKVPPKRLVVPKQVVKLKDLKPEPPPVAQPSVAPAEEPQAGVATGAVGGEAGGVPGGIVGGTPGGVVGKALEKAAIDPPLRLDQVAHPPVVVSRVDPDYPEGARQREIEGRVVLEAIVDREGRIEPEIKVLQSVTMLNNAAITALKQWRFTPGHDENGQAVRVILEVPIRFVLE